MRDISTKSVFSSCGRIFSTEVIPAAPVTLDALRRVEAAVQWDSNMKIQIKLIVDDFLEID